MAGSNHNTINERSRFNNDYYTPGQKLEFIIESLLRHDDELIHLLKTSQIDINAFGDDAGSGAITVQNPEKNPIKITDVIATWSPASTQTTTNPGNPAAGSNFTYTNTSGQPQTLLEIQGTFTADAVALTRFISVLGFDAAGHQIFKVSDLAGVVASTNATIIAGQGFQQVSGATGTVFSPLPLNAVIPPNGTVVLQASPIDPGDTWTSIFVTVNTPGTATLKIGSRTFQLNYASGQFIIDTTGVIQLDNTSGNNAAVLTLSPACPAHLEFSGTADFRKMERP